ncbi:MAG: gluconate transporter [Bacteroidota bacterium]|jgi:gluconate transporter
MPVLVISVGIAFLFLLILVWRINVFVSLILVSLGIGIAIGMPPLEVVRSMEKGVGSTLGSLALILGFGAMLGTLIAGSGAAEVISDRLIRVFGLKRLPWAMMLTGFIIGIPMFYTVAFLMVIPIIFAVANRSGVPLLYVGIPIISSLSVTHGFLPPHPAPTTIVSFYGADLQRTLLYGLLLAVPTVLLAGVFFGGMFRRFETPVPTQLYRSSRRTDIRAPGFSTAVLTALTPVLLMGVAAGAELVFEKGHWLAETLAFLGHPVISLLAALLLAIWLLGTRTGTTLSDVMSDMLDSVKPVAIILLVVAGGGALKQVLLDSGTSEYLVTNMQGWSLSPLVLAWCVAAALRIMLGSATVAALTAAGIVQPLVAAGQVSPELLVLATGAGSLTCSQVNDTGFWLFKEYFQLSITDTLKSWTAMETIISLVGLAGCLLLDQVV